jgi:hypothetical protein
MAKSNSKAVLVDLGNKLSTFLKTDAGNTFAIGAVLADARNILDHGDWLPWLEGYGISETSGRRYLAAHKFKVALRELPFKDLWVGAKSAKLADLKLRASAVYQLAELLGMIPEAGLKLDDGTIVTVTTDDIKAVLIAARETWVGPKRLEAIIRGRHPEEVPAEQPTPEPEPADEADDVESEPDDVESEPTPRQPRAPKPETLAPRVTAQLSFSSYVLGLWDLCEEAPSTLKSSQLKLEQIERVIALLTEVAKLLTPTVVPLRPAGSVEIPIDDVKAAHAATEVEVRP